MTGVATEVIDPTELDRARRQPVSHWTPAGDEALIAISTEFVSGRRTTTASLRSGRDSTPPGRTREAVSSLGPAIPRRCP